MCGIVGFINCGNENSLRKATQSIIHRGPDDSGVQWFAKHNSGLGFRRLSIIDVSNKGHQPMFDRKSKNWIIFNGEIYNFKSIKKKLIANGRTFQSNSDTEVLLNAYAEWGPKCLDILNGMYSFAIYNEESNKVFLARDRIGIKPLYYYRNESQLVFSSEIKAILDSGIYTKQPDLHALHTTIHYQVTPYTGFKDIYKLPAGSYLYHDDNIHTIEKYWDITPSEKFISEDEAIANLDQLVTDSVHSQMIADVPIGAMLSGGLDSSLIAVLMQKNISQPINSFTIKFTKDDLKAQGNTDDSEYARIIAKSYGFNHKEILLEPDIVNLLPKMIWHLDEPIADPSVINTHLIAKSANEQGIKVLLSGMGADEIFGGYRSYLACLKAEYFQKIPKWLKFLIYKTTSFLPYNIGKSNIKYFRWIKEFLKIADLDQFKRHINSKNSALSNDLFEKIYFNEYDYFKSPSYIYEKELFNRYNKIDYLNKMCYCDTNIYICDHNLTYLDKASMSTSIEVRPPLIDHRIVEFLFTLKSDLKIKKNTQKYILKKVAEKYLPKKIIYRPKAPFSVPLRKWIKHDLDEMMNDLLSEEAIKNRGFYNEKYVRKLITDNKNGVSDNSQIIWRLITNEIWFQTFLK